MQAAGPADGEGGHTAISRSLFSSPTPNIMKCFSIRKRLWLSFSAVSIHSAANELPRGAGGPHSDLSIQPHVQLWMGTHDPGLSCPARPLDGQSGAEVAVLCKGQCQAKQEDGQHQARLSLCQPTEPPAPMEVGVPYSPSKALSLV